MSKNANQRVSNSRQRKKQHHLLDVRVRVDVERRQRIRRALGIAFYVIVIGSLLVGGYLGGKEGLRRWLWENPDYFLTDLAAARVAIDKLPQVDRVEVQRTLPNRVAIMIIERKPIAWVTARGDEDPSASEKSFLIDARGVVMRSKTLLPEYLLLPIISGVAVENLAPGQTVKSFEMQAALDLIRLNLDSTRFQVRNIDLSKGYCLVVTDRTRARITFGLDRMDQQLERLNRLLDQLEPTQRELQTVSLLVERNVPVTFLEPKLEELEVIASEPVKSEAAKDKFRATKRDPVATKPTPSTRDKPSAGAKRGATSTGVKSKTSSRSGTRKSSKDPLIKPFRN